MIQASSKPAQPEAVWIDEAHPLPLRTERFEELRVRQGAVLLRGWTGFDELVIGKEEMFGLGPHRALVVRDPQEPVAALVVGEEGSELLMLTLDGPNWSRLVELPRMDNEVGGMCQLETFLQPSCLLLHWELGILALGAKLKLLWRQDLEWNHSVVSLGGNEVWFDLMYESAESRTPDPVI